MLFLRPRPTCPRGPGPAAGNPTPPFQRASLPEPPPLLLPPPGPASQPSAQQQQHHHHHHHALPTPPQRRTPGPATPLGAPPANAFAGGAVAALLAPAVMMVVPAYTVPAAAVLGQSPAQQQQAPPGRLSRHASALPQSSPSPGAVGASTPPLQPFSVGPGSGPERVGSSSQPGASPLHATALQVRTGAARYPLPLSLSATALVGWVGDAAVPEGGCAADALWPGGAPCRVAAQDVPSAVAYGWAYRQQQPSGSTSHSSTSLRAVEVAAPCAFGDLIFVGEWDSRHALAAAELKLCTANFGSLKRVPRWAVCVIAPRA